MEQYVSYEKSTPLGQYYALPQSKKKTLTMSQSQRKNHCLDKPSLQCYLET